MKYILINSSLLTRSTMIIMFLILGGCAVNPVTGKKQVALMSEAQELALGAESDPQIIAQFGLYDDAEMKSFIELHGNEMAAISHRPNLQFHFRILDSPVVNAFAVPGGYVYFTRGIMAHFNNEAEFAGVLGHEIGHVTARHSVDQYTKSTIAQVLLIGGLIVSKELRAFANEANVAMQLMFLKYSRDHESQSDELGVEYSTKVGYDAREMAGFFKTLQKLGDEGGDEIPDFLSTHPNPADRFNNVTKLAAEWQAKVPKPSYKINRDSYLNLVNGIVYGEDPREGYVEQGIFYHPELKFQYPVPSSWDLVNTPTQVQMASPNGDALMVFSAAKGNSLQEVATSSASSLGLTVSSSRQVTINGLKGLEVQSTQTSQDQNTGETSTLQIQSMYISYGQLVYIFHGVALPTGFQANKPSFDKSMNGFKELKDQSKINVLPEKIKVVPVKQSGTLAQALNSYGIPMSRHRELSVINGMDIADPVKEKDKIKILTKEP